MNKILALWGIPRSTSTAFEWMMRQRGDMQCYHEPFGEAWYQGEQPLWPRLQPDSKRTPGLTLESTWAELQAAAEQGAVFIKDFPHHIDHMWDDAMLERFTHSFLIRDPAKTVTSLIGRWPARRKRRCIHSGLGFCSTPSMTMATKRGFSSGLSVVILTFPSTGGPSN